MNEELWKDIKGYEGLYQVSNLGNVKSNFFKCVDRKRKLNINRYGYKTIILAKDKIRKDYLVHRLVALAFIPNLDDKTQVNHIDENPLNNNVNNLEWVSAKENANHGTRGYRIGLKQSRPIKVTDIGSGEYNKYKSITEACEKLGLNKGSVCRVLSNKMRQSGGYVFEYLEDKK